MHTNDSGSGLVEALASYQPTSLPAATWARFRDDAITLVGRLDHDEVSARKAMSRLAVFLSDLADVRPEASLADLLTREQVAGHLQRARAAGVTDGTLENRQGTLNALLRLRSGQPAPRRRRPERHLEPYPLGELHDAFVAAGNDETRAAVDFARTLLCGLSGASLPRRSEPYSVRVMVSERRVTVGAHAWVAPETLSLPTSGTLDMASVERGRSWAAETIGFRLDLRRLALTELTEAVRTRPATEVLSRDGVGRDRLTAAVAAIGSVSQDQLRRQLRRPGPTRGLACG